MLRPDSEHQRTPKSVFLEAKTVLLSYQNHRNRRQCLLCIFWMRGPNELIFSAFWSWNHAYKTIFLKLFFSWKVGKWSFFFSWSEKFVWKSLDHQNRPFPRQKNEKYNFIIRPREVHAFSNIPFLDPCHGAQTGLGTPDFLNYLTELLKSATGPKFGPPKPVPRLTQKKKFRPK